MDVAQIDPVGGQDLARNAAVSRKDILRRGGVGVGALVLGSAVGSSPAAARLVAPGVLKSRKTHRISYGGATCEAFTFAAFAEHLWAHDGINVDLVHAPLGVPNMHALSAGTIDAAPSNFYIYLKPLDQGADTRVTAGLHAGCLRIVVGVTSGIWSYADLKGKTIGTNGVGNGPSPFFSVALAKAGLRPTKDVQWRTYLPAQFGPALERGEIQAVAVIDPAPFMLVQQGKAVEIGSNMTGCSRICTAARPG